MTQPPGPHVVADVGGLAVAEQGPLVIVVDRGTGPWVTTAFVLAVFALVAGGFGVVTLVTAVTVGTSVPRWVATILLAIGIAVAALAAGVVGRIRRSRNRPLVDYRPVAVFDRARRVLLDADGAVLASLDEIRFDTRMRMTSSSPMLVVVTPVGTRILKRGNPFNGGLGNLEAVLTAAVFGARR